MKRYVRGIVTLVLGVSVVASGSVANAQESNGCEIYQTGSNSYNSCTINQEQNIQVTCNGSVYVINNNSQNAGTGGATTGGNTSGGNATSGNAVNENGTSVAIGGPCGTVATPVTPVTPTPTTPVTEKPATGLGTAAPKKVAVLPNTASNSLIQTAVIAVAALGAVAILSRVAVLAYRRNTLK